MQLRLSTSLLLCFLMQIPYINALSNEAYTDIFGVIHSPNYPSYYRNNVDYNIEIKALAGNRIHINIADFLSEYGCDFLYLYDGSANGTMLANITGGMPSQRDYYSSSNWMTLHFHTDHSLTHEGFKINYEQFKLAFNTSGRIDLDQMLVRNECVDKKVMDNDRCLTTFLFDEPTSISEAAKKCQGHENATIADKSGQKAIGRATELALSQKKENRVDPFVILVGGGEFLTMDEAGAALTPGYYWKTGESVSEVDPFVWDKNQPEQKTIENNSTSVHLAYNWSLHKVSQKVRLHTVKCDGDVCAEDVRGVVCALRPIKVAYGMKS